MSDEHANLYYNNIIPMTLLNNEGNKTINYNINDAVNQIISKTNSLKNNNIE